MRRRNSTCLGLSTELLCATALVLCVVEAGAQPRVAMRTGWFAATSAADTETRTLATAGSECTQDSHCADGQGCTADVCSGGSCTHSPIQGCVACTGVYTCPPVEIVFIMDTSGSMRDEAVALCNSIGQLVTDLQGLGISVTPRILGITEAPADNFFFCLTGSVVGLFGGEVPGKGSSCLFPNTISAYESWGPATAIVADRFPWMEGSTRLVVPISDEGPCDGSRPSGCNDPGDDRDSVQSAITAALGKSVIVSPLAGTGSDACVLNLGIALANGTSGVALQSLNPALDLSNSITQIILDRCSFDDRCDDHNVCTTNDRCRESACAGTFIGGCVPCQAPGDCEDHNPCTADLCDSQMCVHIDLHDDSVECCNPVDGSLTAVDDGVECTQDLCDPATGAVTHPAAPQGALCVDQQVCTLAERCDGKGQCVGTDAQDITCSQDADCGGPPCDLATHRCVCNDTPALCLMLSEEDAARRCQTTDSDIFVTLDVGDSLRTLTGGQFFIAYDPAAAELVEIEPGAAVDLGSPFSFVMITEVDEVAGTIFYAVSVPPGTDGTHGPAVFARLRFHPLEACQGGSVCLRSIRTFARRF